MNTPEQQLSEAAPRITTERPSEVTLTRRSKLDREIDATIARAQAEIARQGGYHDYGPVPF